MPVVKIWGRGQLTIPASLRKDLHLEEETPLILVKVGDALLLTRNTLEVDVVAKKAQREMKKAGVSLKEVLDDLDRQRERYAIEEYDL